MYDNLTRTNLEFAYRKAEKRIAELEDQIADIKANCDLAIEGRDIKIKELETENNKLLDVINNQDVKIADLEKQIEQMKCCENCARDYSNAETEEEETICDNCINFRNWELRR